MTGWVRSSHCAAGDCIEVRADGEYVWLRHSTQASVIRMRFTRAEWDAFIAGVKAGDFDDLGADPQ